ncbi:MAG: rhomboid family intramembrane serine protease [Anaerolineales bacterium]|jgi:membrane associated rhomboid family serine protease
MFPIRDTIRSRSVPIVNYALIAANILIFLFESALSQRGFQTLLGSFGLIPANFTLTSAHSLLTIFTSMFLHGSWFHVLSNMWFLFIFGDNVEDRMGSVRYLSFYLLSGVAAALVYVFIDPSLKDPTVGASGAIAGVLGGYFYLFPRARVLTFVPLFILPWFIEVPAVVFLGLWFVLQVFSGLTVSSVAMGGIAWWAHIGGFVFGYIIVRFFVRRPQVTITHHQGDPWRYG